MVDEIFDEMNVAEMVVEICPYLHPMHAAWPQIYFLKSDGQT